jgi:hypothetical protein
VAFKVKVTDETLSFTVGGTANTPGTTTPSDTSVFATNIGHRRRDPWSARYVTAKFTGTPPSGYTANSRLKIVILQPALFNGIVEGISATITILGTSYTLEIVGKVNERGF